MRTTLASKNWLTVSPRLEQVSRKAKLVYWGLVREASASPWKRLTGMFSVGRPISMEEILDARGFEETAHRL